MGLVRKIWEYIRPRWSSYAHLTLLYGMISEAGTMMSFIGGWCVLKQLMFIGYCIAIGCVLDYSVSLVILFRASYINMSDGTGEVKDFFSIFGQLLGCIFITLSMDSAAIGDPNYEFTWNDYDIFIGVAMAAFVWWFKKNISKWIRLEFLNTMMSKSNIALKGVACDQLLLRTFEKFENLSIYPRCPDRIAKEVLSKFRPENTLNIYKSVPDIDIYMTLNLDKIHMWTSLELDQLLIMNSRFIEIFPSKFPKRDINRFLKLWIAGSNRNLGRLCNFEIPTVSERNQVLKGINHQKVPNDVRRQLSNWRIEGLDWIIYGGIDIRRRGDGANATIKFDNDYRGFSMFVWHS